MPTSVLSLPLLKRCLNRKWLSLLGLLALHSLLVMFVAQRRFKTVVLFSAARSLAQVQAQNLRHGQLFVASQLKTELLHGRL